MRVKAGFGAAIFFRSCVRTVRDSSPSSVGERLCAVPSATIVGACEVTTGVDDALEIHRRGRPSATNSCNASLHYNIRTVPLLLRIQH